jgi:hypothetical protein
MRRDLFVVGLLLVFLIAATAVGNELPRIDGSKFASLQKEGKRLFNNGDPYGALKKFAEIYEQEPQFCLNLFALAQTYNKLGEKREAYLFYVQTREAYGRLGSACGHEFTVKQLNTIDRTINGIAVALAKESYVMREERGYGDKCSVPDQGPLGRKMNIPFPNDVSTPFVWWFKGTANVRVECDGKERTLVVGTTFSGAPGPAQNQVWYKKLSTWAWVSVGVGAGLAGVGTYYLVASTQREDDARAKFERELTPGLPYDYDACAKLMDQYHSTGHIIRDQQIGTALAWTGGTLLVVGGGLLLYEFLSSPHKSEVKGLADGDWLQFQPLVGSDSTLGMQWTMAF